MHATQGPKSFVSTNPTWKSKFEVHFLGHFAHFGDQRSYFCSPSKVQKLFRGLLMYLNNFYFQCLLPFWLLFWLNFGALMFFWLCPREGFPTPHPPLWKVCETQILLLLYCNLFKEVRLGGWGTEGPKALTLGRHVSACATILRLRALLYLGCVRYYIRLLALLY